MAIRAHPAWQMQAFDGRQGVAYTGRDRREFFVNPVDPAARDDQRLLIEEIVRRFAAVIPVLDEDWSDAAARTVLPEIRRTYPAITTLSWFAYGRWTPSAMQRIERLSRL